MGKNSTSCYSQAQKDFNYDLLIICNISTSLSHGLTNKQTATKNTVLKQMAVNKIIARYIN